MVGWSVNDLCMFERLKKISDRKDFDFRYDSTKHYLAVQ